MVKSLLALGGIATRVKEGVSGLRISASGGAQFAAVRQHSHQVCVGPAGMTLEKKL